MVEFLGYKVVAIQEDKDNLIDLIRQTRLHVKSITAPFQSISY
ncbi:hypothetical protein N824_02315 [Pedobacter sp. V48]|nr:hypothetical protein N824_02315 [Pedobacter sp. V48]